jgi:hypothetical protein
VQALEFTRSIQGESPVELWGLIAAIAAIVVSAFTAYHIAIRQGVFGRSTLYASFAAPAEEVPVVPIQVVLIAVPRSSKRYLVVGLPLILQNRGAVPIRNLWINLEYAKDLAVRCSTPVVAATGGIRWPDSTRAERLSEHKLTIDHELPLLRLGETMVLVEPINFDTRELLCSPTSSHRTFPVFLQLIAENARPTRSHVRLAFVLADDLSELQGQLGKVVQSIDYEGGPLILSGGTIVVSRLFQKIVRSAQCLLIVPRLSHLGESVSADELLFGNSGTIYQTAEVGVYIKQIPWGKPLSRREVKQIRKSRRDRFS